MNVTIKQLCQRGLRKHDREIHADPGTTGNLTLALCAGRAELKLASGDDSTQAPLVPVLADACLVTMHGDKMLFRGMQLGQDGGYHLQEWSVLVLARP